MFQHSLAQRLRESPNALRNLALALLAGAAILVVIVMLSHPNLR